MKTYIIVTGIIFALITIVHITKMVSDRHLETNVGFITLTLLTAGLSAWAFGLIRKSSRR